MFAELLDFEPTHSNLAKQQTSRHVFKVLSEYSQAMLDMIIREWSIKVPDAVAHMRTAKCNWIMWEVLRRKKLA